MKQSIFNATITAIKQSILLVTITAVLLVVYGCKTPKVITQIEHTIEYKDTTVYRDSIIRVPVPIESHESITPVYDTLRLETSVSTAICWVDTTKHILQGRIANKPTSLKAETNIPTRVITKTVTNTEYKTQVKEVKHIPTSMWYTLVALTIALLITNYKKVLKFFI